MVDFEEAAGMEQEFPIIAGSHLSMNEPEPQDETEESLAYYRLRGICIALVCIALGFFIGRESVRMNWLKSDVAKKPIPQIIMVNPDHIDPPPNGNPFNLNGPHTK